MLLLSNPSAGTAMPANTTGGGSTFDWTFTSGSTGDAAFDFLRDGETLTLTYTLTLTDNSGATGSDAAAATTTTVAVTVTGTNDTVVISNAPDTASIPETNTTLTANGSMTVTDIDLGDTVAATVAAVVISGGSFSGTVPTALTASSNAALKAMLALSATGGTSALPANPAAGSNFTWTFTSGSSGDSAFEFLAAGETLELTYTIKAQDNSPDRAGQKSDSDTSTVRVTITGTNDAPTITAVLVSGDVTEDTATTTVGGNSSQLSSVALAGTYELGDTLIATVNDVAVSYTVAAGDITPGNNNATMAAIAAQLAAAINVHPSLIGSVTASSSGTTLSISSSTAAVPFTLTSSTTNTGATALEDFEQGTPTGWLLNGSPYTTLNGGATQAPWYQAIGDAFFSKFLGRFGNNAALTKTFALSGNGGSLEFDVYRLDSWDGESVKVSINNVEIFSQPFAQWGSSMLASSISGSKTIATGQTVLWELTPKGDFGNHGFWYRGNPDWDNDESFHVKLTLPVGITNFDFGVTTTLDQSASDESWGIDNVKLTATSNADNTQTSTVGSQTAYSSGVQLRDTGSISFNDLDLTNTSSVTATFISATASGSAIVSSSLDAALRAASTFSLNGAGVNAPAHDGTVGWTFALDNALVQYLAAGDTVTTVYRISVTDTSGSTTNQDVTVSINGTNDNPSISVSAGSSNSASLIETNSFLNAKGSFTVSDIDRSNTVSAQVLSVSKAGATTGISSTDAQLKAMLTLAPAYPRVVLTASEVVDQLEWEFNSGSDAFNHLRKGEQLTLTYVVRVTDSANVSADETVTITVTGTNDTPAITATDNANGDVGAVTETNAAISTSGSLTVTDLDRSDSVSAGVSSVALSGTFMSSGSSLPSSLSASGYQALKAMLALTPSAGTAMAADATAGTTFNWAFTSGSSGDAAFDFLRKNETLTLTYTLTLTDNSGASGSDAAAATTTTVAVTITGTNDTPDITVVDVTGGVTEDTSTTASGSAASQVDTITLSGTYEVGDSVNATVNGVDVSYTVLTADFTAGNATAT
jgi:VCBS repeat-containing protein